MPAKRNAVMPETDAAEVLDAPAPETGETAPVIEETEAAPVAPVTESMRINLHVLIDIDPAKFSAETSGEQVIAARDSLKAILIAGGMSEPEALATANKVHKPAAASGPNAVRDAVKEYMLEEMRKLARITEAGAEINYYERPVKEA